MARWNEGMARLGGSSWRQRFEKGVTRISSCISGPQFLLAYRSTPQATTGRTPSFDEITREREWSNKLTQKAYADDKRKTNGSDILPKEIKYCYGTQKKQLGS